MFAQRRPWLNRTVFGIGVASLLSDLSHETVTALLPSFLAGLGAAAAALGTIEGVADGLSAVAKLYGGWWTDRWHRRKPLCASGYGAMAAATLLIATAGHWLTVFSGRTLTWVARGLRTPARKALLAEAVPPDAYGRAFGFERTMDTLGAVAAPVAALLGLKAGCLPRDLLLAAVIPALLAVAAIALLVQETPKREPRRRPILDGYQELPRRYLRLLRWIGLFGTGDFAHSLLILYASTALAAGDQPQQAASRAVALYALHNLCYAASSYPAGWLADRWPKQQLLAASYALGAFVASMVAAGAGALSTLALVFALGGIAIGMQETLEDSLAAELVPADQRGAGFGLLSVVHGAGDFLSSLLTGWLWSFAGPGFAFGAAAIFMTAGAIGTARAASGGTTR